MLFLSFHVTCAKPLIIIPPYWFGLPRREALFVFFFSLFFFFFFSLDTFTRRVVRGTEAIIAGEHRDIRCKGITEAVALTVNFVFTFP